jgi:hypothetical protein
MPTTFYDSSSKALHFCACSFRAVWALSAIVGYFCMSIQSTMHNSLFLFTTLMPTVLDHVTVCVLHVLVVDTMNDELSRPC